MNKKRIVTGQHVPEEKRVVVKRLRREMTDAEMLLWEQLRRSNLGGLHFRRQQVIEGFVVDFYCHSVGMVVELDGKGHENQMDADRQRDAVMSGRGLRVIRFKNEAVVNDMGKVLDHILATADELRKQPLLFREVVGG